MNNKQIIIEKCKVLLQAFKEGKLGYMDMPEDQHPAFQDTETKLVYFTLPMALNYQRNSYTLWKSVLESYEDNEIQDIFNIHNSARLEEDTLREKLLKYKIALQRNKHIQTWSKIAKTIHTNWGSIENLLKDSNYDFLELQNIVQKKYKKGFPYISGPKLFHYWCFILQTYCDIPFTNAQYIEIAPDTHVIQASIKLGVITEKESHNLDRNEISERWRTLLKDTNINPIDMHSPLWFWSRNKFIFSIK